MLGTGPQIPYSNHTRDNELIVQATERGMLRGVGVCKGHQGVEKGGGVCEENRKPVKCLLT